MAHFWWDLFFLKIVSSEEFRDVSLNGFKQMDLSVNEITYLGVLIVSSEGFIDGSLVGVSLGWENWSVLGYSGVSYLRGLRMTI